MSITSAAFLRRRGGSRRYKSNQIIRKLSNETVNNSSTLQDDDDLWWTVGASEVHHFRAVIRWTSNATADIKFGFTVPASCTMEWNIQSVLDGATAGGTPTGLNAAGGTSARGGGAGTPVLAALLEGWVFNSSTAGTVQMQWAQNTQDASDTIVKANSLIHVTRLV